MNIRRWNLACALGLMLVTALACKFSFTTANISSLKIGKDKEVNAESSSFGPNDTVYTRADVSNAPGKIKLKGRLLYDNVAGQTPGTLYPGLEGTVDLPGSGYGTFTFTPPAAGWANGSYKVEVSMLTEDGEQKDQKTATFNVTGGTATRTTAPGETTSNSSPPQAPSTAERDRGSGADPMAGEWNFQGSGNDGQLTLGPWSLNLQVEGNQITGNMSDGEGSTIPVRGSKDGDNLTLSWGSGAAQFTLTGILDKRGDLVGDFVQAAGGRGKWQAQKTS